MKKITLKPGDQAIPPEEGAEVLAQEGAPEQQSPASGKKQPDTVTALSAAFGAKAARARRAQAEAIAKQAEKEEAVRKQQEQEQRQTSMGQFGDLKAQRQAANHILAPILTSLPAAIAELEEKRTELAGKRAEIEAAKKELQDLTAKEVVPANEESVAAITEFEELIRISENELLADGTRILTLEDHIQSLTSQREDAERELAEIDRDLSDSRFKGLEAEYGDALRQYQALEQTVTALAEKYRDLGERLAAYIKEAKRATTALPEEKTQISSQFPQLNEDHQALMAEAIESQIMVKEGEEIDLSPDVLALQRTCRGFRILNDEQAETPSNKDVFVQAGDLLGQIESESEQTANAEDLTYQLNRSAFLLKGGIKDGLVAPNLYRVVKEDGTEVGLCYTTEIPGKEKRQTLLRIDNSLLAPGFTPENMHDTRGGTVEFISYRKEQEKIVGHRRLGRSNGAPSYRRREGRLYVRHRDRKGQETGGEVTPRIGIPGLLAKLRASVQPEEEAPQKTLKARVAAFLAKNTEEVTLKQGEKDVQVRVPAQGIYRVFAEDGKTKVAIGVVSYKRNKNGWEVLSEAITLPGFETALRDYMNRVVNPPDRQKDWVSPGTPPKYAARKDLLVDLHEQAVKSETARLNPKPKAEGTAAEAPPATKSHPDAKKDGEKDKGGEDKVKPGSSLRDLHEALMAPPRAEKKHISEKIKAACAAAITPDILVTMVRLEGKDTDVPQFSGPGWFTILKGGFTLGAAKLKEDEDGGKFTVVQVVTEPKYQTVVEACVRQMVKDGKIQRTSSNTPLKEGLIPVSPAKIKDLGRARLKAEKKQE